MQYCIITTEHGEHESGFPKVAFLILGMCKKKVVVRKADGIQIPPVIVGQGCFGGVCIFVSFLFYSVLRVLLRFLVENPTGVCKQVWGLNLLT